MAETYSPCAHCRRINRVRLEAAASHQAPVCGSCQQLLPVHGAVVDLPAGTLAPLIEKSPLPVLVDFWAVWCGPCRSFAPVFEEAARRLQGRAVLAKLNTETDPDVSLRYQVRGIPTLILFARGGEASRLSGALPLPNLLQWVESSLTSAQAA